MKPPVLLTGATGFLGMEVLARLVEQGDRDVLCLVRAGGVREARTRLDDALARLWDDPEEHADRVRALAGDVALPGMGLPAGVRAELVEEIGGVIHCAASITFDLPLEDARAVNVEGTREVVGLAREAQLLGRLDRFVHVSTAFVCGRHDGLFTEAHTDAGHAFRNTYERTKWEAEHFVASADDLAPVIARPSIVVGEAQSGWTPAFNALYGPLRAFARGLVDTLPAVQDATLDVVPVDYVADALVALLDAGGPRVANLVSGRDAVRVGELLEMASDSFGHAMPRMVARGRAGDRGALDDQLGVYRPYFEFGAAFDDVAARAALEPLGLRCPPLREYFANLVDYAEAARWGKAPMTREAAHRRAAVS